MSNYTEKEIKLLDINPEEIEKKLMEFGAQKDFDTIQNIATYQFPTTKTRYINLLNQMDEKNVDLSILRQKFITFFNEMNNIVNGDDLTAICGYVDLGTLAQNLSLDNPCLKTQQFIDYIAELHNRFYKWIRLRTTNGQTTLTIKEIFSQEDEYPIDKLKEVEFEVGDFDAADKFLRELDFYCDSHQEKRRIQFKLDGMEIVIDYWPMIAPYVEIEGEDPEKIYELVEKLGYQKQDAKVMNTDSVYAHYGINRESFVVITFNEQVKRNKWQKKSRFSRFFYFFISFILTWVLLSVSKQMSLPNFCL